MEQQGCPMTMRNCTKYNITDEQVKKFCDAGCSVICYEEFVKKFVKKKGDAWQL